MIEGTTFLGLSESDARAIAAQAGLQVVVNTAGVPSLLTSAMQYNRLTLTVVGGFVTAAQSVPNMAPRTRPLDSSETHPHGLQPPPTTGYLENFQK
jgi:hypothetical protein